jgi:hypothetical protein
MDSRLPLDQSPVDVSIILILGFDVNLPITTPGRMYFVPEGQHDRSQARSAWSHRENSPARHCVPGYDQPVPPGQKPFAHRRVSH